MMFEFEVNHRTFPASELGESVHAGFAESAETLEWVSLISWEEHCTECAMPRCYETCDLYESRKDGNCRRFHYGFGRVEGVPAVFGHLAKVSFKRWGQLMAHANTNVVPLARARKITGAVTAASRFIAGVPDGGLSVCGRAGPSSRIMRRIKRRLVGWNRFFADGRLPESFMLEVFNPQDKVVKLSMLMRDINGGLRERPFQELLDVEPGFKRFRIPFEKIKPHIDTGRQFHITLCPNLIDPAEEGMTLYFGVIAFVSERFAVPDKGPAVPGYEPAVLEGGLKHVKVLAWDLDNTLWDGILVDDGEERLQLKPGVVDVIRELDRRGIVNSVVSKNDADLVMPVLRRLGVEEYFVFPKISWEPKSRSVGDLIASFNVGADTIAVIDDSAFERAEIEQSCPGVRTYSETLYRSLSGLDEFRPPLSDESARRREFYRAEESRKVQKAEFKGDYLSFLRDCRINVKVFKTTGENVARAHELIQRTNQLNFSGNRYDRGAIERLVQNPAMLPLSISCSDRFGDYGLVGFCLLDRQAAAVIDLMFSCRVQAKRVEHAFLGALMLYMRAEGASELRALYKKTPKNAQAARVFDDLGFRLIESDGSGALHTFGFDLSGDLPQQDVVTIDWSI